MAAQLNWKDRLERLEAAVNQRSRSPAAKRWLLGTSLLVFVVVSAISFATLPPDTQWHWWIVAVLVLVTTPLTLVANAAEYRAMAAISGHRVSWPDAARLSVMASAANLLPIPGGVMVRTQALRREGTTYKRALAANAAAGIAWIAMGCIAAGGLLLFRSGTEPAGGVLLAVAVVSLAAVWVLLRRAHRTLAHRHLGRLFVVELFTVMISSVRLYLAFMVLGQTIEPVQAVALSASMIIAAAIGIFPGGLGLRELLAGAIGVAVGLTAAESVAATAVDRIAAQLGLAIMAAVMLGTHAPGRPSSEPPEQPADPEIDRPKDG